jgi:hypothetical protein
MSEILDFAKRLHDVNSSWPTFFREVLGPNGVIQTKCPDGSFEQTNDYREVLGLFNDLLNQGKRFKDESVKEITLRVPSEVFCFLIESQEKEGFATMNRFLISKLLQRFFSEKS